MALNASPLTSALTGQGGPLPMPPPAQQAQPAAPARAAAAPAAPAAGPVTLTPKVGDSVSTGGQVPDDYWQTAETQLQNLTDGLQKSVSARLPAAPVEQYTPPPPPSTTAYNPMQAWGSAAMMIAGLGSLLTRRSMTNALNAGAQVMNAYKQGDADAASSALATWKTETANALNMQKYELEKYNDIIKDHADDERAQAAALTGFMSSIKDEAALTAYRAGGLPALEQLLYGRAKSGAKTAKQGSEAEELALQQGAYTSWLKDHPNANDAQKLAAFNLYHSKSIAKAAKAVSPEQRAKDAVAMYNAQYTTADPATGVKTVKAGAPSITDFIKSGGGYDKILDSEASGDTADAGDAGASTDDSGGGGGDDSATVQSLPVPDGLKGEPDGTVVQAADGNNYVIQGDQLVPQ
jgi:hypothetical protein